MTITPGRRKAMDWAKRESAKSRCACGCGKRLKLKWFHYYGRRPSVIKGHVIKKPTELEKWIASHTKKRLCACGCGGVIQLQSHHRYRGIPKFINGHVSRVANSGKGKFGKLNPHFKGGRYVNQRGYVQILLPPEKRHGRCKYIGEHRLAVEIQQGERVPRGKVVHHKNRKKSDNRLCNLRVMENANHTRDHARRAEVGFRRLKKKGVKWWLGHRLKQNS